MADLSKLTAWAVTEGAPNAATLSKATTWAVTEGMPDSVTAAKLTAWAVTTEAVAPDWGLLGFPSGTVGISYAVSWDMSFASVPLTYSVIGALPDGLSFATVGATGAHVTGIPTVAGTFTFTLRAVNAYGQADRVFTVTINLLSGGGGSWVF